MRPNHNIILKANKLCKTYNVGTVKRDVLIDCSLEVNSGEFVAIMGASGSGKSTLLHLLGLLDHADAGEIVFEGNDISTLGRSRTDRMRNREIGFVFQFFHLLPELTLAENVMLPAMIHTSLFGFGKKRQAIIDRCDALIASVGLCDQAKQWPNTLSGGERQRTALARALMMQPKILFADEPTGNLDSCAGKAILDILIQLNRKGQTIVMVTHDEKVGALADRTLHLIDGKLS